MPISSRTRLTCRVLLLAVCAAFSGLWLLEWITPSATLIRPIEAPRDAKWITTADQEQSTGCYRREYFFARKVVHAWMAIACEGGFELVCNNDPVGGFSLWRSSRPYQNGLNRPGQKIYSSDPAMALNFPREYQWGSHDNAVIPTWIDVRPFIRQGHNTICIETEGRAPGTRLLVYGEVYLENGEHVSLRSDSQWIAEPCPVGATQIEWVDTSLRMKDWRQAVEVASPVPQLKASIPTGAFTEPFRGTWLGAEVADGMGHDYVMRWHREKGENEAFLRILANNPFRIDLNGFPVYPNTRSPKGLADGGWLVNWEGRRPLAVDPTLLDPDEVSGAFGGKTFENPATGDPTTLEFHRFENTLNRTKETPNSTAPGQNLDDKFGEKLEKGKASDPRGFILGPESREPETVTRERSEEVFQAYGIEKLLKEGENELRIRYLPYVSAMYGKVRTPKFAVDMWERQGSGWKNITNTETWLTQPIIGDKAETLAINKGIVETIGTKFAHVLFIGHGFRPAKRRLAVPFFGGLMLLSSLAVLRWTPHSALSHWLKRGKWPSAAVCMLAVWTSCFAVKACFFERSEGIWFREAVSPLCCCLGGFALGLIFWFFSRGNRTHRLRAILTHRRGEQIAMISLLVLCFILRIWKVDFQPIDDDEFASIQAVISIAEKGVPEIGKDIWYTRSPLYHYAAGLVALVFGGNLWVLRGFSVLQGVLTGWVLWKLAKDLFPGRWIPLGALLMYAVHPFLVFSSHIARFYQQQQLLLLVGIWAFIRGFVQENGNNAWRLGCLAAFCSAILSQEISLTMVPVMLIVFILFAKRYSFADDFQLGIAGIAAGALIFVDILAFQVKCMTRSVGISPNVEATIAPNFWELGNFFALMIGYSRLHLIVTAFVFVGFFFALRAKKRDVLSIYAVCFLIICCCNLLITSASFRYQYTVIAPWLLLGMHGVWSLCSVMGGLFATSGAARRLSSVLTAISLLAIMISWSPWRIPDSYDKKILGDPNTPLRYVAANKRPEDKVMITEPHPHAAKMELGKADFDLSVPLLHDFTYRDKHGVLRDRNGDAEAISNLAGLQEVFTKNQRVWILLNREKFRSRGRNLRWEYPGAREENFIRKNCLLVFRSYLWSCYLWDQSRGYYKPFRSEAGGWTE